MSGNKAGHTLPQFPTLIRAPQIEADVVGCDRKWLKILFTGTARTPIWLYIPGKADVTLNGKIVYPEPFGKYGFVSIDSLIEGESILEVKLHSKVNVS